MWVEELSFAHQACSEHGIVIGTVTDVDVGISALQATIVGSETIVTASVPHIDGVLEHVLDIVRYGGDAVRIDCSIAPRTLRVVRMALCVNAPCLDEHMSSGSLVPEVAVLLLVLNVWKGARTPLPPPLGGDSGDSGGGSGPGARPCPAWKDAEYPLFAHQHKSIAWMQHVEEISPRIVRYPRNIRMTDLWYIDIDNECFTKDPSWCEARLTGAICCDGTGTGKTATALRHVLAESAESTRTDAPVDALHAARGTLVVLPLNLISQWQSEFAKFVQPVHGKRVLWIVQGKDLRDVNLDDLCEADVVFTTFNFMRASKPYCELIEHCIGPSKHRTRASFSAWARSPGQRAPVIEAVTWNRVVIDELHHTLANARDMRQLRLLRYRMLWGLTATPDISPSNAYQLYALLHPSDGVHRDHPNLLSRIMSDAIQGTPSELAHPIPRLHLVQLSQEDTLALNALSATSTSAEDVVRMCTSAVHEDQEESAETIDCAFEGVRDQSMAAIRSRLETHARAMFELEREHHCLEDDIRTLIDRGGGEEDARDRTRTNLQHVRQLHDVEQQVLNTMENASELVARQLTLLKSRGALCSICMDRNCEAITPCAHIFCSLCIRSHVKRLSPTCPVCRSPLDINAVTKITSAPAPHHKLTQIVTLLKSLEDQPVILFVQWKGMAKSMKSFMMHKGLRLFILDGNLSQRVTNLHNFESGGVLILCLEDSFEGLHLPHARTVIFAHALVGDKEHVSHMERQAIARCVRHGQTSHVTVYSFIIADCFEEELWRETHDVVQPPHISPSVA